MASDQSPFYVYRKNLCYLVFNKKHGRFVLGFIQGYLLEDIHGLLKHEDGQKEIRHLVLNPLEPVSHEVIADYVALALEVQDQFTLIK